MGGLRKLLPYTWAMMLVGTLALTGFPLTAGYFSKDAIIEGAFAAQTGIGQYAFYLLVFAAFMTSFYSWRLMFMTFEGRPRASADVMSKVHESPKIILVPLFLLAIGELLAGLVFHNMFIGEGSHEFWREAIFTGPGNNILEAIENVPTWVVYSATIAMVTGFLLSFYFYIIAPMVPVNMAATFTIAYKFLLNKWYFDEIYDFLLVRPTKALGYFLWKKGDGWLIDGFGPDGVSARVLQLTGRINKIQSGFLYHYAFAMLIGVAAFATFFIFSGVK
jgi:NADH-quinone oxidoreductase subunit L